MAIKQIGKVTEVMTGSGYTFRIVYHVDTDEELITTKATFGTVATWAPVSSTVSGYKTQAAGTGWFIYIDAVNTTYNNVNLGFYDLDKAKRNYKITQFVFQPEFWGVRLAGDADSVKGLLNISGAACKVGDWLYRASSTSDKGLPVIDASPFGNTAEEMDGLTRFINQRVYSQVYTIDYYEQKNINSFSSFIGYNGSFKSGYAPSTTTTGYWQAMGQDLQEIQIGVSTYVKAHRQAMSIPATDFKWKGSAWTW